VDRTRRGRLGRSPAAGTGACPASHPVAIPEISYNFAVYVTAQTGSPATWRFASDRADATAPGVSLHADWMNGWDPEIMAMIVENCLRRLSGARAERGRPLARPERLRVTLEAAREVVRPSVFGVTIIMIVYLPILTLTGVEGKMFRPMAITVVLALLGALLLSLTFVPAAVALFLGGRVSEREPRVAQLARGAYGRVLPVALRHGWMVVGGALPFLETGFRITTEFSWLEMADLNHPLLKRMSFEAPGTFYHSQVVARALQCSCH